MPNDNQNNQGDPSTELLRRLAAMLQEQREYANSPAQPAAPDQVPQPPDGMFCDDDEQPPAPAQRDAAARAAAAYAAGAFEVVPGLPPVEPLPPGMLEDQEGQQQPPVAPAQPAANNTQVAATLAVLDLVTRAQQVSVAAAATAAVQSGFFGTGLGQGPKGPGKGPDPDQGPGPDQGLESRLILSR